MVNEIFQRSPEFTCLAERFTDRHRASHRDVERAQPGAHRDRQTHISRRMLAGVLGVTPAWLIAGIGEAPKDDLSNTVSGQLRDQLAQVKKLHEQTGKAISALEMEINRVLQDM